MEIIIKKAIEGGWDKNAMLCAVSDLWWHYEIAVLDPVFWQALSKACGWKSTGLFHSVGSDTREVMEWEFFATEFYRKNLTEGWDAAIKYLQDLIQTS